VRIVPPPPADLGSLATRAQAGDTSARAELLSELYRSVRKHVHLIVGGSALADDIVQEVMIALHHGLAGFRGDANPRSWALAIATRIAHRLRRKESRYVAVDDIDYGAYDSATTDAAELAVLQRALAILAPKKRDAFVLMAIFELSAEEAGRALGTFANTAASRYRHARAELEAYFVKNFDEIAVLAPTTRTGHG
jgi:RNA polymerase sigma-70 factor (ECF subfamily)